MSLLLPLDHVILLVTDLAAAGAAFEAAGFTVTPEARHSAQMGTANRCVMLDGSYIELLSVFEETPANAAWRALLEEGPRLGGLALASSDIVASATRLVERGVQAQPMRCFRRETTDGDLRFSVVRIDQVETPGLQCLFCQHHTPTLLWRAGLSDHANGATSLLELSLPQANVLDRFAGETGIPVIAGPARLTIGGKTPAMHDLTHLCGVILDVRAP